MAQRIRELKGKAIVDMQQGIKIGTFDDLLISPDQLIPKLLVTSRGGVFSRKVEGIPIENVRVWGKDVILVDHQDVIRAVDSLADHKQWVLATEQLKGRTVVSIDGKRVGQVDDFLLDESGRITALGLSQVFIKGPLEQMREIPIQSVRSLGPDVVIMDLDGIESSDWGSLTEDELSQRGVQADEVPPLDARPSAVDVAADTNVYAEPVEAGGARIYSSPDRW